MADPMLSAVLLRLRAHAPFFATLAAFVGYRVDEAGPRLATDGRCVYYRPSYLAALSPREREAALTHCILHAALLHVTRRGARDPKRWNIAADIAVNGVIASDPQLSLPHGFLRRADLENKRVEEIYELVAACGGDSDPDLLDPDLLGGGEGGGDSLSAHWRGALEQARVVAQQAGRFPAGIERVLRDAAQPSVDWRTHLWRFLVRTPTDFAGFDRRHVHRGLYIDELASESVTVHIAVDTSGSIDSARLDTFLAEVFGILRAYPHVTAWLSYTDAKVYGPYRLAPNDPAPRPHGGGGTDFRPFFAALAALAETPTVAVYLTDGHGVFPELAPHYPVLWTVPPGGLEAEMFPFGEVTMLLG
jgi:predicted metal-dependent peptidase